MLKKIKNRLEKNLVRYLKNLDRSYSLSAISPLLFKSIKEFVSRKGKRVRPLLFILGYLGFAKKTAPGLYDSALSLELLHDFMLVHDDIIDKSELRRGKPSMHTMLNMYLRKYANLKFNGQELAIVIGDVMYAMALHTFLSIKEEEIRKERAFKKLIEAAIYTGNGEFIELIYGIKDIERITQEDIYKIYDLKTAYYTFSCPLAMGATLAGAGQNEVNRLFKYGVYLGRAFQIKDDILGMFSPEIKIGKSTLTDLQEAKKTLLLWYAYKHSSAKIKSAINYILAKEKVDNADLLRMREIIIASGALDYAKHEVSDLQRKAQILLQGSRISWRYKETLYNYSQEILNL